MVNIRNHTPESQTQGGLNRINGGYQDLLFKRFIFSDFKKKENQKFVQLLTESRGYGR